MITKRSAFPVCCLCAALLAATAPAATLYWDPDGTQDGGPNGADGGAGTWTGNVWWNGAAYTAGAAGDNYVVGGTAGTITNSASKTVTSLRVSTSGYTLGTSEVIISSAATTAFTLDPSMTMNLNSRIRNTGGVMNLNIGSGSTVAYGATSFVGNSNVGGSVYGGGTLQINSGGFGLNWTVGSSKVSGAGTTLKMNMTDGLLPGYLRVELGGIVNLNNKTIGDLSGATLTGDLFGATVTGTGSQWLGGGTSSSLAIRGSTSGSNADLGKLSILAGGMLNTNGGKVGLFSTGGTGVTQHDDADLVMSSGGSMDLGNSSGRLILGFLTDGALADTKAVNLTLSGGGSIGNGQILLTTNNTSAKTRTLTVADDVVGTDFTISSIIANGNQAGSGINKSGAGTLLLSGNNTYTGTTTVSAGTLKLSGTLATSKIIVNSTMIGGGGTIKFLLTGPAMTDIIDVNGTMDLGGMSFDLSGLSVPVGTPVTLLDYSTLGSSLLNFPLLTYSPGWTVTNDTGSSLLIGVIPEPAVLTLFALAAAGLAARRRRAYFPRRASL